MDAPNTFSTYDMNQWFNFSITFANGYALSTLLPNPAYVGQRARIMPVSQLEENKIEIAIMFNDEPITLNDGEDIAYVDPTQLAQVITILSGLPRSEFDCHAGFAAIRSVLSQASPSLTC